MMSDRNVPRRNFLKQVAGSAVIGGAVPYYFSATKTLADETKSANDRFRVGVIGAGGISRANMNAAKPYCDVVAICDVDSSHSASMNQQFSGGRADVYTDYRELLERQDLDAVHVATPDHWHTKPLVEAMLAGHDVYCEKPLTLTIDEGKLIRKVQKETKRVVQVGTQQRSTFPLFVKAIAMVHEGRLGKIKRLEAGIGGAPKSDAIPVAEVPKSLDWDRWLGPTPAVDYRFMPRGDDRPATNCHYEFRWWYQFSGGKLTDWGAHHVDISMWALEAAGQDATPQKVGGTAEHPVSFVDGMPMQDDRYNTATRFDFKVTLPEDVELAILSGGRNGVLIEGEKGRIFVNRQSLEGSPVDALKDDPLPEDAIQKVYKGSPMESNERRAHWANFFHAVRERIDPISDVHSHMRALMPCHLAGISARLGREIEWDGEAEQIVGDEQANSMLAREYRKGYEIEM